MLRRESTTDSMEGEGVKKSFDRLVKTDEKTYGGDKARPRLIRRGVSLTFRPNVRFKEK